MIIHFEKQESYNYQLSELKSSLSYTVSKLYTLWNIQFKICPQYISNYIISHLTNCCPNYGIEFRKIQWSINIKLCFLFKSVCLFFVVVVIVVVVVVVFYHVPCVNVFFIRLIMRTYNKKAFPSRTIIQLCFLDNSKTVFVLLYALINWCMIHFLHYIITAKFTYLYCHLGI